MPCWPTGRFWWTPAGSARAKELLAHHIARCGAVIDILKNGVKTAEEIAAAHFDEKLLEGYGSIMAANEIVSHCELLIECGQCEEKCPYNLPIIDLLKENLALFREIV